MKKLLLSSLLLWCLFGGTATAQQTNTFHLQGDTLLLPSPIGFAPRLALLEDESLAGLQYLKAYLEARPYISKFRIESYTDTALSPKLALSLSKSRSMAIAMWLVQNGIDCHRLVPVGFGSENETGGLEKLLFINAALRGRPLHGKPVEGSGYPSGDPCRL